MGRARHAHLRDAALLAGGAVSLGAALAPLDGRFATHMVQHLLLGDLGPLLVAVGLTGRPPRRRRALRFATHPLVAFPVWAALLVGWHLAPLYDAALRHDVLHALQHATFFLAGTLLWAALLEPVPGPAWFTTARKLPYVVAVWLVSLALSQLLLWSGRSYYGRYTLGDQRAGGGVMLVEGSFVMLAVVVWLLLRLFDESEQRQRLLEAGR